MNNIYFFKGGTTAVTDGEEQIPELQVSWAGLFADFLESKGVDPGSFTLFFPNGKKGRFFKAYYGWSWGFENEPYLQNRLA